MEAQRFTFAVCIGCGVQSPPVILPSDGPKDIAEPLHGMGWKFDRLRFNVLATCPACQERNTSAATG